MDARIAKLKEKYRREARAVWGSTGMERRRPEGGRLMHRWIAIEDRALRALTEVFGFSEVDRCPRGFVVDAVATDQTGRRVLVDVTCRLQARMPEKVRLAESLRMPLFVLFASPEREMYVLREMPKGQTTMRLPMAGDPGRAPEPSGPPHAGPDVRERESHPCNH